MIYGGWLALKNVLSSKNALSLEKVIIAASFFLST